MVRGSKWIVLVVVGLLLAPPTARAVQQGLESIDITPAEVPADPAPLLTMLRAHPGFVSAEWDTARGLFHVTVADSIPVHPRLLMEELKGKGLAVKQLEMEFLSIRGVVDENDMGYLVSPSNDLKLPVLFTLESRRFWGFWGENPRGRDADFRLAFRVHPGAQRPDGTFAPDTAEVLRFQLTKPAYKTKSHGADKPGTK